MRPKGEDGKYREENGELSDYQSNCDHCWHELVAAPHDVYICCRCVERGWPEPFLSHPQAALDKMKIRDKSSR